MERRTLTRAALAACLVSASGIALAQDNLQDRPDPADDRASFASTGTQIEAAAKLYMAQNGDTVAGKKVELIVKDDTGLPDVTKRIAQELVVNDKVDVLAGFGLTPLALAVGADRHAVQDAAGGDGRGDFEHHRGLAVHRAHQLHAAAGGGRDGRLGAQERHQEGRDPGHRLRPGHRRREVSSRTASSSTAARWSRALRVPLRNPDFAPFLQKVRDAKPDALFVVRALGRGRGA